MKFGGVNSVFEALKSERTSVDSVFIGEGRRDKSRRRIERLAGDNGVPVEEVSGSWLDEQLPESNHQGMAVQTDLPFFTNPDQFLSQLESTADYKRLVILDQVQDPVNLGKIVRTALFFGVDGLIKTQHHSAPYGNVAVEVSSGAAFHLPVCEITNLQQMLTRLEEDRYWSVGTALGADQDLRDVPTDRNLVYLFGHEGSGLRRLTRDLSDYLVHIHSPGDFDSLNVATAAGVVCHCLQPPTKS